MSTETLTAEQRIERNYWEHEWCVIWPDRDDYSAEDLAALVKAGKLTETVLVCCPEGHGAWAGLASEAEAYFGDCAACDDPSHDPEDYAITERKFVMSEEWKASLGKVSRECPHCDGTGKEPIVYCDECKKPCDSDGYCGPCADKAVEKWIEEHGGRSPGEEHELRMTERAVAAEKATLASVRLTKALSADSHALFLSQESLAAHEELFDALRSLGRLP